MDPFTQRREIFILLLWTVFCFGFGRRDAPTANLTVTPKAALERSYTHFFCNVTGFPAPNITWYKNDSAITRLHGFTRLPAAGGEFLRLGPMRWYRHDGVYHCRASNEVGAATSKRTSLIVYKAKRTPQEFPRIIKNPSGQRIYTGDDARYECNATGNPAPKISWMVHKLPLNLSNPRYSLPSPGVLIVANIQQGDHDTPFECVATNIHGMVYSRSTRLMHEFRYSKPVISKPPQPVTVDPETVVYLYCSAYGLPHPAIIWERDGQSYTSTETTYGKLVIPNIQKSGKYTCVAQNHFGQTRASAYVTVRKLPFTPSRPTTSEITPHTITITWRPGVGGPPVKSFTVYHRSKSSSDWTVVTRNSGRCSLTLENLKPYTTYQFRVFALNNMGTSKPSSLLEVTTHEKAPGTVPRNIQARGISDNSFEATWLPPLEPNGLIYGYRLFYTTDLTTDFSLWRYKPSKENGTVVERLQRHTTYYFRIAAYNVIGQGPLTELYAVKVARGAPGQPEAIQVTVLTPRVIHVTWKPPKYEGNGVFGYEIHYNKSSSGIDETISVTELVLGREIRDLRPYTYYKVQVVAKSAPHDGPRSFAKVFRTSEAAPSGPPQNIRSKALQGSTSLEINWDPPLTEHRNGRITNYTLKYKEKGERARSVTVDGSKTSYRLHSLKKNTPYYVWVSASTSVSRGPMSRRHEFTTAEDVSGACRDLKASSIASEAVTLSWRPPVTDAAVIKYKISYSATKNYKVNGANFVLSHYREVGLDATSTGLQSYTIDGLVPYTKYMITLWAVNSIGDGRKINITTETDKGNPPPLKRPVIMKDDMLDEFIQVQLETASERNGPISYYLIIIVPLGDSNQLPKDRIPDDFFKEVGRRKQDPDNVKEEPYIAAKFGGDEMPKRFNVGDKKFKNGYGYNNKELTKGVYYTMFTRAYVRNNKGDMLFTSSPFSTPVRFVPSNGAPRELNCVVKNSSIIEVSWKQPSQTQEGRIQGYMVFYAKVDDQGNKLNPPALPQVKYTQTENDSVLVLTHLEADTTYLIQVAAFSVKGFGAPSIPRLAKTFPKLPDPPYIVASMRSSSDVLIRWRTLDTNVLSRLYKLRYGASLKRLRGRQMEELKMKEITFLSKNSHVFKGLDPGVWYLFKISVRNKIGWSKESFVWAETAPAPPSGPPLDVRASTLSSISVRVTWKKPDQWKRNGPLIGYAVVYNPLYRVDLSMVKNVTNPNQTILDVTDLMMYTDYEIRVRAHGLMGPGPLSLPVITKTAEGEVWSEPKL